MEIRQLEYFEAVARLGNFTRAAEEAFVSQPGVSASIRKLEAELGVELLQRTPEGVKPTSAGKTLLDRTHQILSLLKDTRAEINNGRSKQREQIKVGLPPMLGASFLAPVLSLSGASDVLVDVTVHEIGSHDIREELQGRDLDVGVVLDDAQADQRLGLVAESLGTCQIMLGMPPNHPLATLRQIPVGILAQERLVVMSRGALIRDIVIEMIEECGVEPHIVHTSTQISVVADLLRLGLGLSFFPEMMKGLLEGIVLRPLSPRIDSGYSLVYRKGMARTPGFLAVAALITDLADTHHAP